MRRSLVFCVKKSDGILEIDRLPKWHLLTIKEVDLLTRLGRLFGYHKIFKLSGDWVKNEISTTREMTKTVRDNQLLKKNSEMMMMNEWRWKWERFLGHMVSQKQMSIGLIGVDTNLWWERLKDMIKLYGSYKWWDNNGVPLRNISNIVMLWSNWYEKAL